MTSKANESKDFTEDEKLALIRSLNDHLTKNTEDLPADMAKVLNDNFMDMLWTDENTEKTKERSKKDIQ